MNDTIRELALCFEQGGYIRWRNPGRLKKDGSSGYKKGDEVRFIAPDKRELRRIQALLTRAGFRPGRPFAKWNKYCLPLYGLVEVRRFLELLEDQMPAIARPGRFRGREGLQDSRGIHRAARRKRGVNQPSVPPRRVLDEHQTSVPADGVSQRPYRLSRVKT